MIEANTPLMPCPFCGGVPIKFKYQERAKPYVRCSNCGAECRFDIWNTRATPTRRYWRGEPPYHREECERNISISIRHNEDGTYSFSCSGGLSEEHVIKALAVQGYPCAAPTEEEVRAALVSLEHMEANEYWRRGDFSDDIEKIRTVLQAALASLKGGAE